jgi:sigma-B regulation protein RsbU (phosphoserine phosphatase)
VLQGLNLAFDMDLHDNKYFTIWYGVFRKSTRHLFYAGGGHPPALLREADENGKILLKPLDSTGPIVGMMPDMSFETQTVAVEPGAKLYLFSDGVFEIDQPDGTMWKFENFVEFLSQEVLSSSIMDRLLEQVQALHGSDHLSDDFSIVEIAF